VHPSAAKHRAEIRTDISEAPTTLLFGQHAQTPGQPLYWLVSSGVRDAETSLLVALPSPARFGCCICTEDGFGVGYGNNNNTGRVASSS
jgi:hypothetical protein